nr:immunoglobulin heavy chain junction region [Macaca mulatta]MOX63992.1 immunoglobulin heavy chain junction region [Macaca mulatta]MOX66221.1 immunoglobulin heavy chain junction region [Macaca mulatta]MOX67061.1 immunoglobulin heavy chain junction region [Macaca mulatta]MOX67093.1 immunoglobulin heavy chain junction region [Macaca mulatta]
CTRADIEAAASFDFW